MFAQYIYWLTVVGIWYFAWLILSLLAMPVGSFIFHRFSDKGYPFYRLLTLGVSGYLFFLLSRLKILSISTEAAFVVLILFAFITFIFKRKITSVLPSLKTIISYEIFFFIALLVWSYVKGSEPSIRSLEKYMDFGFIQSILNSKFMPPQDMWFASTASATYPINYYYFGHFLVAFMTKLTNIAPSVTYNLTIATIFAISMTVCFSIGYNLYLFLDQSKSRFKTVRAIVVGIIAAYVTTLGGNLHTIYLFTKGYPNESPVPFWTILSWFNPQSYWYPNATRFIPFTIHEFPSYSYVVSDLHGHVLDIPFVLLLIALFIAFIVNTEKKTMLLTNMCIVLCLAIAYMTNSTDFLVYGGLFFFIAVVKYQQIRQVLINYVGVMVAAFLVTFPFSASFKPFASTIGLNCAPSFLVNLKQIGPLVFEKDKCQTTPVWMLGVLWGFFWIQFVAFLRYSFFKIKDASTQHSKLLYFIFFGFVYSILLTMFSEFFYFKDIYPAHFRANTMFKLGYQAFIIMSVISAVAIVYSLTIDGVIRIRKRLVYLIFLIPTLFLVCIYPFFSVPSYFGDLSFKTLDGSYWIKDQYPAIPPIIDLLNKEKSPDNPFAILEAHGDSYTDYNVVSSQTGLPTIVGWPVHEWLWRGTYDIVGPRVQEVQKVYEGTKDDLPEIRAILKKYNVRYIVVTKLERDKYPALNHKKFGSIASVFYRNGDNYIFQVNLF